MISDDKMRKRGRYIDYGSKIEFSRPVHRAWSLYSGVEEGRRIGFMQMPALTVCASCPFLHKYTTCNKHSKKKCRLFLITLINPSISA